MTSSFRVRIHILSSDRIPLLSLNELWEVTRDNNSRQICKQAIITLSLAYSFQKMFFIGQNLKHVHMAYSFLKLLIFFWLTRDISCLKFLSLHIKEILYIKTNFMGNQSWSKNEHFHLFLILMLKKLVFKCKIKTPYIF